MQVDHEANRAYTQMMRRATHNICAVMGDMLARLLMMARGLTVDEQRMRENLDLTGGLILAEALMLELGRHIGRQEAHDVVYEISEAAFGPGASFSELLAADPRSHNTCRQTRYKPCSIRAVTQENARFSPISRRRLRATRHNKYVTTPDTPSNRLAHQLRTICTDSNKESAHECTRRRD
jgi:hypothetical protein